MSGNLDLLVRVAGRLRPLLEEVVFVGGAVVELYITLPVSERIRPTDDTDVICRILGRGEYRTLTSQLEDLGFRQSLEHNDPPYRWRTEDDDVLDVMPTSPEILGFSNRWYDPGLEHPVLTDLEEGLTIRVLAPPYFLASKIEAHRNRGGSDPYGSPDFEDVVVLLGNRPEIVQEIEEAPDSVRLWLREEIAGLFPEHRVSDYISAHLPVRQVEGLEATVRRRIERLRRPS